jgi:hypothetical protein
MQARHSFLAISATHVKRQEENKEAPAHAALSPGAHSTCHPLELLHIHLQDKKQEMVQVQ